MTLIDKEAIWVEGWYELTEHADGVVSIGEPNHQEEVYSYLVRGQGADLLIDTGMGVVPIGHALEKVRNSDKPLIVVNTHSHFDHIGGNGAFESVLVSKNEAEVATLNRGWSAEDLARYSFARGFRRHDGVNNTPSNFDAIGFSIPPQTNFMPVLCDKFNFDLGGRVVEVIETPGHTPGGLCFFDKTNRLLFSGDMLYEGPLYAFEGESDPEAYLRSLKRIKRLFGDDIRVIHPGHNFPENEGEPKLLDEAIKLFKMVKDKAPYDAKSLDFPGAVEYVQPGLLRRNGNGKRRLSVVVSKDYVKWD